MSIEEMVRDAQLKEFNNKNNFESGDVMKIWRKEDDQIKAYITKLNVGKKVHIWKQPTFFDKARKDFQL